MAERQPERFLVELEHTGTWGTTKFWSLELGSGEARLSQRLLARVLNLGFTPLRKVEGLARADDSYVEVDHHTLGTSRFTFRDSSTGVAQWTVCVNGPMSHRTRIEDAIAASGFGIRDA